MFAACYLLVMLISLVIFSTINLKLNTKILIAALLFTIFALVIIPLDNGAVDATKYFAFLDYLRHIRKIGGTGAAWMAITSNAYSSINLGANSLAPVADTLSFAATPVMGLIMLIMSYFPNELLMAIVAFADYYLAMKIIQLVVEKNQLPERYFTIAYLIFCCLFVYSAAVSGIRNNFVGTAFAYAALRYTEQSSPLLSINTVKLITVTLLLSLIHQFTLILFLLFMIAIIFYRTKLIRFFDGGMFLQSFLQGGFLALLRPLAAIPFFSSILYKSTQYLGSGATIHISSTANLVRDLARLAILLLIFSLVHRIDRRFLNQRYTEFVLLLFCFIIGSFRDQLLFDRCLLVMLPIMLPFITLLPVTANIYHLHHPHSAYSFFLYLTVISLGIFSIICLADNLRAGSTYFYFLFQ